MNYRYWYRLARQCLRLLRSTARRGGGMQVAPMFWASVEPDGEFVATAGDVTTTGQQYQTEDGVGGDPDNALDVEAFARFLAGSWGYPLPGHFWG